MTDLPHAQLDAWRAVLNAHAAVVAATEEALAEAQLPPLSWYDVLWALKRAPTKRMRMTELASSLTISRGGATKLADRLEREGLLRREPVPEDGRGYRAVLEPAGERMLRKMWPVYSRVLRDHFSSHMTAREARQLVQLLGPVAEAAR